MTIFIPNVTINCVRLFLSADNFSFSSLVCFVDCKAALYQVCDGQCFNTNNFVVPLKHPNSLINVYPNDDALTRKNCLSRIIEYWVAKRPETILKTHVPITIPLDLDYAEYIEYSLAEADSYELCQSMEANGDKEPSARDWWILKPAMTDCGYGIRIFSTMTDLVGYLESVESDERDSPPIDGNQVPSSLLREFVAQKYLTSIPLVNGEKFHVRAYVLAIGRLQVFVYQELLALIASEIYRQPWDNPTSRSSLTNSSLQPEDIQGDSTRSFWSSIPDDILPGDWKEDVFRQICQISAEIFRAASQAATGGLVLLPGCFELFALDFLIDSRGSVWLLEVNGGPAIPKEGEAGSLALRLLESITSITLGKLTRANETTLPEKLMIEVLNDELGKSNIREII